VHHLASCSLLSILHRLALTPLPSGARLADTLLLRGHCWPSAPPWGRATGPGRLHARWRLQVGLRGEPVPRRCAEQSPHGAERRRDVAVRETVVLSSRDIAPGLHALRRLPSAVRRLPSPAPGHHAGRLLLPKARTGAPGGAGPVLPVGEGGGALFEGPFGSALRSCRQRSIRQSGHRRAAPLVMRGPAAPETRRRQCILYYIACCARHGAITCRAPANVSENARCARKPQRSWLPVNTCAF
jgi:hypothetical protein